MEQGDKDYPSRMIASSSESLKTFFSKGPFPLWLPVIISCSRIVFCVEAKVQAGLPVKEVRGGDMVVKVNRCELLDIENGYRGKIFFSGYIKGMVEYFLDDSSGEKQSNVRFTSVKIPVECYSDIEYCTSPHLKKPNHIHPVELIPGLFTEESKPAQSEKQDSLEFLQCEILDASANKLVFCKEADPEQITGKMTVAISFFLLQKRCMYLGR